MYIFSVQSSKMQWELLGILCSGLFQILFFTPHDSLMAPWGRRLREPDSTVPCSPPSLMTLFDLLAYCASPHKILLEDSVLVCLFFGCPGLCCRAQVCFRVWTLELTGSAVAAAGLVAQWHVGS